MEIPAKVNPVVQRIGEKLLTLSDHVLKTSEVIANQAEKVQSFLLDGEGEFCFASSVLATLTVSCFDLSFVSVSVLTAVPTTISLIIKEDHEDLEEEIKEKAFELFPSFSNFEALVQAHPDEVASIEKTVVEESKQTVNLCNMAVTNAVATAVSKMFFGNNILGCATAAITTAVRLTL